MTSKSGGPDDNDAQAGHLVSYTPTIAAPLTRGSASSPGVNPPGRRQEDDVNVVVETVVGGGLVHSLTSEGSDGSEDGTGRGTPIVSLAVAGDFSTSEGVAQTVRGAHGQPGCVAVQPMAIRGRDEGAQVELGEPGEPAFSIRTGSGGSSKPMVAAATTVRRLTELECERLQGFPDQWTDDQSGAARYRQLGNAVAVPCVEWLVGRLVTVDSELYEVDA